MSIDATTMFTTAVLVAGWMYFLARGRAYGRALVCNVVVMAAVSALVLGLLDGAARGTVAVVGGAVLAAQIALGETVRNRVRDLEAAVGELARREYRLGQAASIAKLGYYVFDTSEERVVECNEQHARNHGLTLDEYINNASTLSNGMPLVHPGDRDKLEQAYECALRGEPADTSYRVPTADGLLHVKEITQPLFDDDGSVVAELGMTMDITEQVNTERRLLISQRHETTGRVAAGIAHDFNNLLAIVLANLEELARRTDVGAEYNIRAATQAVERGAELARNLLGFAGKAELDKRVFDLNEVVIRVADMTRSLLPPTVVVDLTTDTALHPVQSDVGLAESALLNLVLNARDAMPNGGRLRIATANATVAMSPTEQTSDRATGQPAPARYASVTIADTGSGISSDDLARIFDPFFTTKEDAAGSGLGLSMVEGFMSQTGGAIDVSSEPDSGTSFRLLFPAATDNLPDRTLPAPDRPLPAPDRPLPAPDRTDEGGDTASAGTTLTATSVDRSAGARPPARILVAENDPQLLEVVSAFLTTEGYEVVAVPSGDAAWDTFIADPAFDLLVTDVVMPGERNGTDLVEALRDVAPDLPVVFITGYSPEPIDDDHCIQLRKPFQRGRLLDAVTLLLHDPDR